MGFSKKPQGLESDGGKKWVVSARTAGLKPINTKQRARDDDEEENEPRSTTPTSREARIPEKLMCPPAPVKRRPPLRCGGREFFTPPDLETVFKRHVERAN